MSDQLRRDDGVIHLSGALDRDSVTALLEPLRRVMGQGAARELDLAQVARVDSAGLALVLEALALARSAGYELRTVHVPAQMAAIARACGVAELLGDI